MTKQFNEYRFEGLNYHVVSNQYWSMNRVSDDEQKIVVKFDNSQVFGTKYGYGVIMDAHHVVFVKDWCVGAAPYGEGVEVLFDKQYFKIKEWGDFSDKFADDPDSLSWDSVLNAAKEQQANPENSCMWHR